MCPAAQRSVQKFVISVEASMQEEAILRQHGHTVADKAAFLEEVGLSPSEWREWVRHDAEQQAKALSKDVQTDWRSPEDMMEDMMPDKRHVAPIDEPVYDMRKLMEKWEHGPWSDKTVLPEFLQVRNASATFFKLLQYSKAEMRIPMRALTCTTKSRSTPGAAFSARQEQSWHLKGAARSA